MPGSPKKRARKEIAAEIAQQAPVKPVRGAHLKEVNEFDQELADKACDLIEYEAFWPEQAARAIGLNGKYTLESWAKTNSQFGTQYARARANASHKFASKAMIMLENAATSQDMGGPQVQAVKNCAAGYQWYASKLEPKIYGDKLDLTATVGVIQLTDAQIDAKLDAILAMQTKAKNG